MSFESLNTVNFDQQTIDGFTEIINDELAYDIFLHENAIVKEIENHISGMMFLSPPHMLVTASKLLSHYIETENSKSVIGYAEDSVGAIPITTHIANQLEIPFYPYNMVDGGLAIQTIKPEHCPCTLIIPYTTNDIQIQEIIERFNQNGEINQIISLVEEHPVQTNFSKEGIKYIKIANWDSIREKMQKFKNIIPERKEEILNYLK